jgi:hypothetical protein
MDNGHNSDGMEWDAFAVNRIIFTTWLTSNSLFGIYIGAFLYPICFLNSFDRSAQLAAGYEYSSLDPKRHSFVVRHHHVMYLSTSLVREWKFCGASTYPWEAIDSESILPS